ncbi:MAG: hypothetical protein QNJ40_06795 [Xanthomonadales bacterium]|nr:hypothetical protein [Xanthomonadales bacterium]
MAIGIHEVVNYSHVAVGSLALAGSALALGSSKGSSLHVRGGKLFAWMMLLVVLTTAVQMTFEFLPLAIIMCLAEAYLIPSAILAFHRDWAGFRAVSWALAVLAGLLCLFTLVQLVRLNLVGDTLFIGPGVLALMFGFLLYQDFGMLRNSADRSGNYWVRRHLIRMILAFTFAVMALIRIGIQVGLTLEQTVIYPLLAAAVTIFLVCRRYSDGAAPA